MAPPQRLSQASLTIPENSSSEWAIAFIVFSATCLYLRLFYNCTVLFGDEGLTLVGAERVLNGAVPYRDFFSFFTPGSYYWFALQFKIFGDSILVARAALVVYGGIFSFLISKHEWIPPGLQHTAQFNEVLSSLERACPNLVIFSPVTNEWMLFHYPNTPPSVLAAKGPVADFILTYYHRCGVPKTGDQYRAVNFVRKELNCQPDVVGEQTVNPENAQTSGRFQ
jgi:hypothetical protein